jgi:hypothetical protein
MNLPLFAHTGHEHAVIAAATPWWKDELAVSAVIAVGLVGLLLAAHYFFKATFALKMLLAMAYLLVVGVLCYSFAPILSIIALTTGMALALVTTMLQLAHKNSPHDK